MTQEGRRQPVDAIDFKVQAFRNLQQSLDPTQEEAEASRLQAVGLNTFYRHVVNPSPEFLEAVS
jgi:hypothetical protein